MAVSTRVHCIQPEGDGTMDVITHVYAMTPLPDNTNAHPSAHHLTTYLQRATCKTIQMILAVNNQCVHRVPEPELVVPEWFPSQHTEKDSLDTVDQSCLPLELEQAE